MSLPPWDYFMIPVLQVLSGGEVQSLRELRDATTTLTGLTEAQLAETLPTGKSMAANRIGWAASYLTRVGALDRPRRGHYQATDLGMELLAEHPAGITEAELRKLAKEGDEWWLAGRAVDASVGPSVEPVPVTAIDPTEQVEQGVARIHQDVAAELLERLVANEPTFFERVVVDLLVAMGYGGADGRASVTKQSGDEGIDGIIDQDALGLNRVYVQAKRYAVDRAIGRPDLQAFVGALSGKADGGVFITTARFSRDASVYADGVPTRLVLIDGARLTSLMIRYGVGVQVKDTYRIVEIDEDFFE
ncbi:restriction endonuclease [Nocardioides marmoribigeumensis]|uniref:Restriction system protein n=1 Tax=Nocardioides marmoribigeumensis TaxID=433649 RepID=A0ABU2BUR1_9ACTN|nr:restriction endonuclease [Nocardioides marmoribigeumensis]MDR7362377.1 restriction system protein [Nocardioides marmoribigeumensis]